MKWIVINELCMVIWYYDTSADLKTLLTECSEPLNSSKPQWKWNESKIYTWLLTASPEIYGISSFLGFGRRNTRTIRSLGLLSYDLSFVRKYSLHTGVAVVLSRTPMETDIVIMKSNLQIGIDLDFSRVDINRWSMSTIACREVKIPFLLIYLFE